MDFNGEVLDTIVVFQHVYEYHDIIDVVQKNCIAFIDCSP